VITDVSNRYGYLPTITVGGSVTVDVAQASADAIRLNVTAASTLNFTNGVPGMRLLVLMVATGAGTPPFAITVGSNVKTSGAISLATIGSGLGLTFLYDGKNYLEIGRSAAAVVMPA